MKVDTVLVPLDGSPLAEMALSTAIDLLRDSPDATLILLRAAEATTLPGVDPTDAQVGVVREAEEYLEVVAARARDEGVSRVITSVWYSQPAEAIAEAARVRGVDLIVMSTHGRSGLRRVVLGSVAESVLRATQTPILRFLKDARKVLAQADHAVVAARETTAGEFGGLSIGCEAWADFPPQLDLALAWVRDLESPASRALLEPARKTASLGRSIPDTSARLSARMKSPRSVSAMPRELSRGARQWTGSNLFSPNEVRNAC